VSYDLIAVLLSVAVSTLLGIIAWTGHRALRLLVSRFALPLLWISSREARSTFSEFSRRSFSNRELFLGFWLTTFIAVLTILEVLRGFVQRGS
jgi:hypothetical protein